MRLRIAVLVSVLLCNSVNLLVPLVARAASSDIYISELQTGGSGTGHADDEFIELYNAGADDVALTGWQFEYRSVSAGADCTKGWTNKLKLTGGTIPAHGFFLLAAKSYLPKADATFAPGLSGTSGAVRIVSSDNVEIDALAWSANAPCGNGLAASAPTGGHSLERLPGAQSPQGGNAYDTASNSHDFTLRSTPEPQNSSDPREMPVEFTAAQAASAVSVASTAASVGATSSATDADATDSVQDTGQLELSELLIDPVAPQTDAADEFVEVHNMGPGSVQLSGYTLKLGTSSYHFPDQILAPDAYFSVRADTSPLSLTNTGGTITLLDTAGAQLDTATWPKAVPGASWIKGTPDWMWTTKPTPAAENIVEAPLAPGLGSTDGSVIGVSLNYASLDITELLPDPASPGTDAADEFIELRNPNLLPVNLAGYSLKTGKTLSDHYTLPDVVVAPGEYIVFKSGQTHLTLANAGSSVALFDPTNAQVGETITYGAAKTGQSWAYFESGWAWTGELTPGAANIFATTAATSTAAKATKAAKTSAAKATKTSTAKATTKTAASKTTPMVAGLTAPSGNWLLFALVGLTICYCLYEFRHDIRSYYHRLRGYTSRRRPASSPSEGR